MENSLSSRLIRVCKVICLEDKKQYAIKYLDCTSDWRKEMTLKDYQVNMELNHPNILKMHAYIEHGKFNKSATESTAIVYQVIEYCTGDLLGVMLNCGPLPEKHAFKFFEMIINACQCMHSQNISHQDLKAERCFVNKHYEIKIGAFMFSTKNVHIFDEFGGTLPYISPEKLSGIPCDPYLVDIFSCGVILYMMLTGYMPFKLARADDEFYKQMYRNKELFWSLHKGTDGISKEAKDLIEKMLEPNPLNRIKLADIYTHSWFKANKGLVKDADFVSDIRGLHKKM